MGEETIMRPEKTVTHIAEDGMHRENLPVETPFMHVACHL